MLQIKKLPQNWKNANFYSMAQKNQSVQIYKIY